MDAGQRVAIVTGGSSGIGLATGRRLVELGYDVVLTVVVILVASLNVGILKLVARLRTDISRRLQLDKGKLMGTAMGGLQMIETLKATGGEAEFFARWAGYQAKSLNGEQGLSVIYELADEATLLAAVGAPSAVAAPSPGVPGFTPGEVSRWVLDRNQVPRVAVSLPDFDRRPAKRACCCRKREKRG